MYRWPKGHETCATSLMIRDMKSIYLTCHVARISDCFITHNHKPKWLKRIFYHSFGVSHTQTQLNWALLFPASLMRLQGRCWTELGSLWKSEWLGKFGFQAHRVGWSHSIPCSPLNAMPPLLAGCWPDAAFRFLPWDISTMGVCSNKAWKPTGQQKGSSGKTQGASRCNVIMAATAYSLHHIPWVRRKS